jgi:hypothetical protein
MRTGQISVSTKTKAEGFSFDKAASTHQGWSKGAKPTGTSGNTRCNTERPVTVVVDKNTSRPPVRKASTKRVAAMASPTLAPCTQMDPGIC